MRPAGLLLLGSLVLLAPSSASAAPTAATASERLGLFTAHGDIGAVSRPGTAVHDPETGTYTIGASGVNMWGARDAFHYAWKEVSGDIAIEADIAFVTVEGTSPDPHRKACLVIRQSLDADSAYADVALHGDGLTSLQFRETAGGPTSEVQSSITAPRRLRLEKIGGSVYLSLAAADGTPAPSGCSIMLPFTDPFYIGLGVCAHNDAAFETAVFSHVSLGAPTRAALAVRSSLEFVKLASGDRRVVHHTSDLIEAPNWSRDGSTLIFNSKGRLYSVPAEGGKAPVAIDTGFAVRNNNDHGLSPDGTMLAISDQTLDGGESVIHVLPATGGTPRRVTALSPSYWHGWSPDGATLAYTGRRDNEYDIYTIPVAGGAETRLTDAPGLDDGPDYSPDGKYIYFNSERSGHMQIWRMLADGSQQEQITRDEFNNWFPHPSPDGKWLVFLAYEPGVVGHPADRHVTLRLLSLETGEIRRLARLFGGQGTINVPSWSPDSTRVAYVRYQSAQAK